MNVSRLWNQVPHTKANGASDCKALTSHLLVVILPPGHVRQLMAGQDTELVSCTHLG